MQTSHQPSTRQFGAAHAQQTLQGADMDHLTGPTVERLMRQHGKTIAGLAQAMNITQARVRQVRARGVQGSAFVRDWMEAITGKTDAGWCAVAQAYAAKSPQNAGGSEDRQQQLRYERLHHLDRLAWLSASEPCWHCGERVSKHEQLEMQTASRKALHLLSMGVTSSAVDLTDREYIAYLDSRAPDLGEGFTLARSITEDDIEHVLREHSLRVCNTRGQSFGDMADELIGKIDGARVKRAALKAGTDLEARTTGALAEIKNILVELGVLES